MINEINEKLLNIIKDNPDLNIVARVFTDMIVDDTYAWWQGRITDVSVEEFVTTEEGEILCKDDYGEVNSEKDVCDDHYDLITKMFPFQDYSSASEDVIMFKFNKLEWDKAIIIDVNF